MDHEAGKYNLLELAEILEDIGVPYFLTYGTALGAYRDGGFTPHERDIDIGFLTEQFIPIAPTLGHALMIADFELITINNPFTKCRAIKARKRGINADLVSFTYWSNQDTGTKVRFSSSRIKPYSMVYPPYILEDRETVELFGRTFEIPSPIETYLRMEYGDGWKIPKEDFRQQTRVSNFRAMEGIPADLLEQFNYEQPY